MWERIGVNAARRLAARLIGWVIEKRVGVMPGNGSAKLVILDRRRNPIVVFLDFREGDPVIDFELRLRQAISAAGDKISAPDTIG